MATHTTVFAPETLFAGSLFPEAAFNVAVVSQDVRHRLLTDASVSDGKIVGTTKVKGLPSNIPKHARVRLYHDRTGTHVAETWSDPGTGEYQFLGWDRSQRYTVVAYDPTLVYRAVVADGVLPEAL